MWKFGVSGTVWEQWRSGTSRHEGDRWILWFPLDGSRWWRSSFDESGVVFMDSTLPKTWCVMGKMS